MAPGRERPIAGRVGAAATRLMAALAAAGLPRLDVALNWHPQVWTGRPRPRAVVDNGTRAPVGLYRFEQQKKFARRFMAAQRGERAFPRPL